MAAILVVEDVPAVLMSLRVVLESVGHKVIGAQNGNAGLAQIKDGAFDLVITDIWMPGLSGTEVIRLGREQSPRTRFLAITGGDPNARDPVGVPRVQSFGADRVLLKPFDMDELITAVAALLPASGLRLVSG